MLILKKIWKYLVAGILGILAGFALFFRRGRDPEIIENTPLDPLVDSAEAKVDEINKKLQDLDDNGVSDLSPEEVVEYWNKQ